MRFWRPLFVPLPFFFWSLHCLSFFVLRILITTVVSSIFSHRRSLIIFWFSLSVSSIVSAVVIFKCWCYWKSFAKMAGFLYICMIPSLHNLNSFRISISTTCVFQVKDQIMGNAVQFCKYVGYAFHNNLFTIWLK